MTKNVKSWVLVSAYPRGWNELEKRKEENQTERKQGNVDNVGKTSQRRGACGASREKDATREVGTTPKESEEKGPGSVDKTRETENRHVKRKQERQTTLKGGCGAGRKKD